MNILRWIICAPIAIVAFFFIELLIDIILEWLYETETVFWDFRFELFGIKEIGNSVMAFLYFIFTSCLNPIFSASVGGVIGGSICPCKNPKVIYCFFSIAFAPIVIIRCISSWHLEHIGPVCVAVAIITGIAFVLSSAAPAEEHK